MKLKRLPEDFQVEEQLSLATSTGPFALYRLTKQSLGTLEAVAAIARHWKLPREALAFAGLKDKHALTTQHVTIRDGQRRGFKQEHLSLEYVGQLEQPIHASHIEANRFVVVIRDLSQPEADRAAEEAGMIATSGLPNYFDNQRFGSLGESGEFIALPWCRGNYERALWLALTDPNVHDHPDERTEKLFLREHWGNWTACRQKCPRSRYAAVLAHLASQPTDFRRAITRVPQDLRSLWLAAFQSHLWNQLLAAAIRAACPPEQLTCHTIAQRSLPFFSQLTTEERQALANLSLPLPSARLHLADERLRLLYDNVLADEGLELRQIRVKYPRDSFFSKGDRPAVFAPAGFHHEIADDDLYPGCHKLILRFALPRGSYATILVKRVVGELGEELSSDS
jgi:tRNA pseudouridine13 synthase